MNKYPPRITNDRFGNPYQLIGCKPNKGGFPVGYIELGGKTYKVEPSPANKEGVLFWVKVTKLDEKKRVTSM